MGKLVLIGVVFITLIISGISVSVNNRSNVSFDSMALRDTQNESKLLANYAMQYGIQVLNDKTETPNSDDFDIKNPYKKTFASPFAVKDGIIDSLVYSIDNSGNVIMDAHVTYSANDNVVITTNRAVLEVPVADSITLGKIKNALTVKGPVEIQNKPTFDKKGNPTKGIHGDVASETAIKYKNKQSSINGTAYVDSFPTFDSIFGMTLDEVKNMADYVGENPPDYDGITVLTPSSGTYTYNANSTGSGILIVDGDLRNNGTITFNGIVWITGQLTGNGTPNIYGALFAGGIDPHIVQGDYLLVFDPSLTGSTITGSGGSGSYKILAIYEDFRK